MNNSAIHKIQEGTRLSDTLVGTEWNDLMIGYEGADSFVGGPGHDTVSYAYLTTGIRLAIHNPQISTGDAYGDTFTGVEAIELTAGNDRYINSTEAENYSVYAGQGDDVLSGGDQGEFLAGEAGDDEIHGMHGNDTITGGIGSDDLRGYGDHDVLIGGAGADRIDGGSGVDIASYEDAKEGVRLYLHNMEASTGDAAGDQFLNIEIIHLTSHDDYYLNATSDQTYLIAAGAGNDTLIGGDLGETFQGDDGDDFIHGMNGQDILWGGEGNDLLFGFADDDYLYGGAGNDTLSGGAGIDHLTGGDGQDRFVFLVSDDVVEDYDIISDFTVGEDVVDLSAYNPGHLSDTQMFNSLYIVYENGGTSIYIDTLNVIRLIGVDSMTLTDFVFS